MTNQRVRALAVSMLMPAMIVAGCTKPTVTADVFAPPAAATPEPSSSPGAPTAERPVASLGDIVTRPGTAPLGPPAPSDAPAPRTPLVSGRPAPAEFAARPELADFHFDFDRYDIRPGDARGTDAYNLALGDRRAKAAMDYLVSRGIQADRITTLSYGKERPVCREHTEACWAKNRRAAFSVKAR